MTFGGESCAERRPAARRKTLTRTASLPWQRKSSTALRSPGKCATSAAAALPRWKPGPVWSRDWRSSSSAIIQPRSCISATSSGRARKSAFARIGSTFRFPSTRRPWCNGSRPSTRTPPCTGFWSSFRSRPRSTSCRFSRPFRSTRMLTAFISTMSAGWSWAIPCFRRARPMGWSSCWSTKASRWKARTSWSWGRAISSASPWHSC